MANGKDERDNPKRKVGKEDFLSGHGMSSVEQDNAVIRASAPTASDFEGEYEGPGTYNSPGAQFLQRIMWESRMRRATGIPKVSDMSEDTDEDEK
jgi:hypothetical protein